MKRVQHLPLVVMLTVALMSLVGCHGGGYDVRLVAADSVMREDPAMALELLDQLSPRVLNSKANRAYHALLQSQARYRCYVTATSDSLINVAVDYYRHHQDETEKLTRAYIYKGAVMNELGDRREAMVYYKKALATVASDDKFNQGYIRLGLGGIYSDFIVADSADVTFFKEALHYFSQVPDSFYIASCLNEIGISYYKTNEDSVMPYLERGLAVARAIGATELELINLMKTAQVKMFSNSAADVEQAKQIALSLLKAQPQDSDELRITVAYALAKQNKTDSARYYLNQVPAYQPLSGSRVLYNRCLAEIARSLGDVERYQYYYEYSDEIADSAVNNTVQHELRDVEARYDNEALKYQNLRYKTILALSVLGALLLLSILAMALLMARQRIARSRQRLKETEEIIDRLQSDSTRLAHELKANKEMSGSLKETLRHQLDTLGQLVVMRNKEYVDDPKGFNTMLKNIYEINKPDDVFWVGLRTYVNNTRNGIIDRIEAEHPSALIESDIRYLCLYCSGIPSTVVMACMGYNDLHSVYNKKRRIVKKLGLHENENALIEALDEYITSLGGGNPVLAIDDEKEFNTDDNEINL